MMLTPEHIQQAKNVSIVAYLQSLGISPVKMTESEWVYLSPMTQEHTASMFVNPHKNVFSDYSSDTNGDVIRLVRCLQNCSFSEAVNTLNQFTGEPLSSPFSFSGNNPKHQGNATTIQAKPLQHPALIQYLESRNIPFTLGRNYLSEIHYENAKGKFFSLGFANDKGGFELRNYAFKGSTSPKGITTFKTGKTDKICLFEGFFDFLSALVYFKLSKPRYTTIVLNSTSNLQEATPALRNFTAINAFLDNDTAGVKTIQTLEAQDFKINNFSHLYQSHKDFNQFIHTTHKP